MIQDYKIGYPEKDRYNKHSNKIAQIASKQQ